MAGRDPEAGVDAAAPAVRFSSVRAELGRTRGDAVVFELDAFHLSANGRVAVTGPSGCGKSTLLHLASGLLRPDVGTVEVLGRDLGGMNLLAMDRFRGRHIGFIFQTHHLVPVLTPMENLLVAMRFGRGVPRGERQDRARVLLQRVRLDHVASRRVERLSVGERQRVAIARAVANRPRLILADEPTGSLDQETAARVFDLMLEVCEVEGSALLLVTHDLALAGRLPEVRDARGFVHHLDRGGETA